MRTEIDNTTITKINAFILCIKMLCIFLFCLSSIGWSVSIDSRRCFFYGCAINYDPLETIEAAAHGTYEIDLFGGVHFCHRYITVATAHCRSNGWHFMRHRAHHHNGTIFKRYYKIWTQSKGKPIHKL